MNKPYQLTGKKQTGHEYIHADEEAIIAEMIEGLEAQLTRMYTDQKMLRQVHTKMHGCVKAQFIIEKNLDPALKVGVFKDEIIYPAWIRFSNASTVPKADKKKDIRGIALKLMNVPGDKLLDEQTQGTAQDFLLMSSETFFSKNLASFSKLLKPAIAKSKLSFIPYILNPAHWSTLKKVNQSNIPCKHPFLTNYWSTQPYQFGAPSRAVKYFIRPSVANRLIIDNTTDDNYLRINMAKTLAAHDASFDFCVQFQEDAETMPIEDPTVAWKSPYIKLATIRIPVQTFDTPEQMEFGDNLSFNIWHSLPEHRPLGSFNRARKRVYQELSRFRHDYNHLPVFEPEADNDFFKPLINK